MFNSLRPSDAYMRHKTKPSLIQIVACRLAGASHHLKQCGVMWIGPWGTSFNIILVEIHHFHSRKCVWICRLQKIAANLSRPHCVNNLVTISTTTRFGERSAELILMTWELISFFSRQMKTFVSEVVFTQISARFSLVSVYVSFFLDHYGICHLISKKAIDPNVCLSQSYNRISYNISPRQFHIPGNIWRVILGFEAGRVLVWHWRLELLLSHHYSVI